MAAAAAAAVRQEGTREYTGQETRAAALLAASGASRHNTVVAHGLADALLIQLCLVSSKYFKNFLINF